MKANELRIGNYVKSLNTVCTIDCIFRQQVEVSNNYEEWTPDLEDIKPIPLTEDWLLKFGFNKGEDIVGYCFFIELENIEDFTIHLQDGKLVYFYEDLELKYVHQLQNLYFALTGEELTIK